MLGDGLHSKWTRAGGETQNKISNKQNQFNLDAKPVFNRSYAKCESHWWATGLPHALRAQFQFVFCLYPSPEIRSKSKYLVFSHLVASNWFDSNSSQCQRTQNNQFIICALILQTGNGSTMAVLVWHAIYVSSIFWYFAAFTIAHTSVWGDKICMYQYPVTCIAYVWWTPRRCRWFLFWFATVALFRCLHKNGLACIELNIINYAMLKWGNRACSYFACEFHLRLLCLYGIGMPWRSSPDHHFWFVLMYLRSVLLINLIRIVEPNQMWFQYLLHPDNLKWFLHCTEFNPAIPRAMSFIFQQSNKFTVELIHH